MPLEPAEPARPAAPASAPGDAARRDRLREEYSRRLLERVTLGELRVDGRWELEDLQAKLGLSDEETETLEAPYRGKFREHEIGHTLTLLAPGSSKTELVFLLQEELRIDRANAIRIANAPGGTIASGLPSAAARRLEGLLRGCGASVTLGVDTARFRAARGLVFEFVWIPRGRFRMGDEGGQPDERPVREVEIRRGFWLMRTPVTQFQWERIMGVNPSAFPAPDAPVETVSWLDCQAFIRLLRESAGGTPLRLPREEEWEYACRAGTTTSYYWGGIMDSDRCVHLGNASRSTRPVAGYMPNAWGLHDMLGNVWEWCEDPYREDAYARLLLPPDGLPAGEASLPRVTRGGGWNSPPEACRSAVRGAAAEYDGFFSIGFRLAMDRVGRELEFGRAG